MDFESKWYQQAAAMREKHKVSLSFKPRAVYCFCLFFVLFIVLFIVFVLFFVCFFGLFFWGGVFLVCFLFFFIILIIFNFPMNEGLSTS